MTTKIELILINHGDSTLQRELIVNGESILFQKFDSRFLDKNDFIHEFSKKVLNGIHDETPDPSKQVLHNPGQG